jgi:hypothetical protein
MLNSPPHQSVFKLERSTPELFKYDVNPGDVISHTGEPTPYSWAGKFGRTTEATAGRVNSMKRTVRWDDGTVSKEVEILPFHLYGFAMSGDEGSLVFNLEKEWVGMVVGGDCNYAGYITPVSDIIADIEAKTGGTITLV